MSITLLSPTELSDNITVATGTRPAMTLRLSLTDRCNFRCRYCMPEEGVAKLHHANLPSLEQLTESVLYLKQQFNVTKVKLTGGEPLVRKGVSSLISAIYPHVEEVSMTTNGALLPRFASELKSAGLSRVNISLDSLDPVRFRELTRGGALSDTLEGIESALLHDLKPVKLNAVLQRSGWQEDAPALLDMASDKGVTIRFIELMRTGTEIDWAEREFISADEVKEWLTTESGVDFTNMRGSSVVEKHSSANAPARTGTVLWKGSQISVGWITPRSNPFCDNCNRLRLDARGNLRRCLMDSISLPLTELLSQLSESEVNSRVNDYLNGKRLPTDMSIQSPMIAVGG